MANEAHSPHIPHQFIIHNHCLTPKTKPISLQNCLKKAIPIQQLNKENAGTGSYWWHVCKVGIVQITLKPSTCPNWKDYTIPCTLVWTGRGGCLDTISHSRPFRVKMQTIKCVTPPWCCQTHLQYTIPNNMLEVRSASVKSMFWVLSFRSNK